MPTANGRRPRQRARNRHPRPNLSISPPAFNKMISAQIYSLTPSQAQITFQEPWASPTDTDYTGFIRVDVNGSVYTAGFQQNGGDSDTLKVLDFGTDIYGAGPVVLTVISQPAITLPGGPLTVGQQIIAEQI